MNATQSSDAARSAACSALEAAMHEAARALQAAMNRLHPRGTTVRVLLSCRQRIPTEAEILCASGDGTYRVRMVRPNQYGRRHVKTVHWSRVQNDKLSNTGGKP